jgi:hypothetical protein
MQNSNTSATPEEELPSATPEEELNTGTLEDEERTNAGGHVWLGSSQSLQEAPSGKHSPIILSTQYSNTSAEEELPPTTLEEELTLPTEDELEELPPPPPPAQVGTSVPNKSLHTSAVISAHLSPILQKLTFLLDSNPSKLEQEKTKNIASKRFAAKTKIIDFFMLYLIT